MAVLLFVLGGIEVGVLTTLRFINEYEYIIFRVTFSLFGFSSSTLDLFFFVKVRD